VRFPRPGVFRMHGDEALMYAPAPGDAYREQVLHAGAACPVQAIRVDRIGAREAATPTLLAVAGPVGPASQARPSGRVSSGPVSSGWRDAVIEALRRGGRIVIVGASLAGLRAPAVLRREGFTGSLTMIGDEPYQPYDRPPRYKQVLDGWTPPGHTGLPRDGFDARWLLDVRATGLVLVGKQVRLAEWGHGRMRPGADRHRHPCPALVQRRRGRFPHAGLAWMARAPTAGTPIPVHTATTQEIYA
jgi:hypothetical protein